VLLDKVCRFCLPWFSVALRRKRCFFVCKRQDNRSCRSVETPVFVAEFSLLHCTVNSWVPTDKFSYVCAASGTRGENKKATSNVGLFASSSLLRGGNSREARTHMRRVHSPQSSIQKAVGHRPSNDDRQDEGDNRVVYAK